VLCYAVGLVECLRLMLIWGSRKARDMDHVLTISFVVIWYLMITIDANAMLVGIMNPVYFQMCADMALQRYIHKEKRKSEKVGISGWDCQ
jgi:hypothetical protein